MDKYQKRVLQRRKKRLRQLRQRFLFLCLALAIGILVLVLVSVTAHQKNAVRTASAENATLSGAENAATLSVSASTGTTSAAAGTASASAGLPALAAELVTPEPAADRTSFAVDPSDTTWNYKDNGVKTVYLTLDDGPSANTSKILDILDEYGIKATFFVTGQNSEYFDMIREEYDRGNTVGLHSYVHEYDQVYASTDAYFADLDKIGALVKKEIGYVPCFIRFPGGASNTVSKHYCEGIMTELSKEVQAKGYQYWDWNVSSGDGSDVTKEQAVANATSGEGTNLVLLSHDAVGKETTVEALPEIIEYYQNHGYVFKPLTREAMVVHHEIFN